MINLNDWETVTGVGAAVNFQLDNSNSIHCHSLLTHLNLEQVSYKRLLCQLSSVFNAMILQVFLAIFSLKQRGEGCKTTCSRFICTGKPALTKIICFQILIKYGNSWLNTKNTFEGIYTSFNSTCQNLISTVLTRANKKLHNAIRKAIF